MEREVFAHWELEHAEAIHAAQPVKEEEHHEQQSATQNGPLLLNRAGWHHRFRRVIATDSEARKVSRYRDTGKTKYQFSEDQTEPVWHTRKQWREQGMRIIVNNSFAKQVAARDGMYTLNLFTFDQTEPV